MKIHLQLYTGQLINFFISWFTIKGWKKAIAEKKAKKEAEFFGDALLNLQDHVNEKRQKTRETVVKSAQKKLKTRSILGFHGGRSVTKTKLKNHQLATAVEGENKQILNDSGLKVNKKKMVIENA
ncbi:hypothetical protein ACH3O9_11375 [Leeuwenhoekiella sp. A16]|uniref:hypothetical protein n=1 Tax=Leeuwenhoekiella sp. A16 TaxID=3141462 RepID=UPI003A80AAAC